MLWNGIGIQSLWAIWFLEEKLPKKQGCHVLGPRTKVPPGLPWPQPLFPTLFRPADFERTDVRRASREAHIQACSVHGCAGPRKGALAAVACWVWGPEYLDSKSEVPVGNQEGSLCSIHTSLTPGQRSLGTWRLDADPSSTRWRKPHNIFTSVHTCLRQSDLRVSKRLRKDCPKVKTWPHVKNKWYYLLHFHQPFLR